MGARNPAATLPHRAVAAIIASVAIAPTTIPALAGSPTAPFPSQLSDELQSELVHRASERLDRARDDYNRARADRAGLTARLLALGFNNRGARQILGRMPAGATDVLPEARREGDRLVIEQGGHRLELSIEKGFTPTLEIDGRAWRWNWKKSVEENLRKYDAVFEALPSQTTMLGWLLPEARADDGDQMVVLKAAGLFAYFTISGSGEIGGELYQLEEKVKRMLALCRQPEPPHGQDDPFVDAIAQSTHESQQYQGDIPKLHNCAEVKALAKDPVAYVQGEPVFSRVPLTLCPNLNALAVCMHQQMDPSAVSDGKIKRKPRDHDEWYDPKVGPPPPEASQPAAQSQPGSQQPAE